MAKQLTIEDFLMLIVVLFVVYFFLNIKETFEQIETKPKPKKECSQASINSAYNDYIFGGVKFVR